MGLISGLLTLPLAPVRGVAWIGEQIAEEADRELDGEARIRRELGRLGLEHELGRLSAEEFEAREDELLEQLEALHTERRRAVEDGH
ncbi:MAG: gas vesicle protein GvpG [Thermoleophilaceae bacterium]